MVGPNITNKKMNYSKNIPWDASDKQCERAHKVTKKAYEILNKGEYSYRSLSDILADEAERCEVSLETFIQALAVAMDQQLSEE